jgi:hypothetical protein
VAALMATYEELVFRITADNKGMGNPLAPFQRDLDEAQDELAAFQAQLTTLDNESVDIDIDVKTESLARLRREVARIRDEIANAVVLNIHADTREAQAMVAALNRQIKALSDPPEKKQKVDVDADSLFSKEFATLAARSGVQFFSFFVKAIQQGGATGGPAIAAALAVVMGGALTAASSLVVAGGGLAILTAGIVSAFKDPDVVAAAAGPVNAMKESFAGLGDGLGEPIFRALEQIADGFDFFADTLEPVMNEMSGIIDLFGAKGNEAIRELAVGFAALGKGAGPVLTVLANELPDVAKAIRIVFEGLAKQGEGAALVFKLLMNSIEGFTVFLGFILFAVLTPFTLLAKAVDFVSEKFKTLNRDVQTVIATTSPWLLLLLRFAPGLTDVGNAAEDTSGELKGLAIDTEEVARAAAFAEEQQRKFEEALKAATKAANDAAVAASEYFTKTFGLVSGHENATLDVEEGWLSLNAVLTEGARTLHVTTQEGIDNRREIVRQVEALANERDTYVALGFSVLEANAAFLAGTERIRQNTQDLGFNAAAVEGILGKYERIPKQQLVEIQTAWSGSANPELARAELVKQFGEPVVQEILAEIDHDSVKFAKTFFGAAFGDPVQEQIMLIEDPEGFMKLQKDIAHIGQTVTTSTVTVVAEQDPASFDAVKAQLKEWNTTRLEPTVFPFIDGTAWRDVNNDLATLQVSRYVAIKPYLDPQAVQDVENGLPGNAPGRGFVNGQSATTTPAVNVYLDGEPIRAALQGEVNASIERATVAASGYRRL